MNFNLNTYTPPKEIYNAAFDVRIRLKVAMASTPSHACQWP